MIRRYTLTILAIGALALLTGGQAAEAFVSRNYGSGVAGPIGLQGQKGDAGATGSTGPQGAQGVIGPTGATGATGPQGAAGNTGATGSTGTQGPQGNAGTTGAAGAGFGSIVDSAPTRSFGSAFTPSASVPTEVHYSVGITGSATLSGGFQGRVEIQVGGVVKARCRSGQTGTLVAGMTLTVPITCELSYLVPAGTAITIVSTIEVGTPTFAIEIATEQALN